MNWLDKYLKKNETGYLCSEDGGLFVEIDEQHIRGVGNSVDDGNLKEISKDEFIHRLFERVKTQ